MIRSVLCGLITLVTSATASSAYAGGCSVAVGEYGYISEQRLHYVSNQLVTDTLLGVLDCSDGVTADEIHVKVGFGHSYCGEYVAAYYGMAPYFDVRLPIGLQGRLSLVISAPPGQGAIESSVNFKTNKKRSSKCPKRTVACRRTVSNMRASERRSICRTIADNIRGPIVLEPKGS